MGEKSGGSEGTGYDFWFDGIPLICIVSVGKFFAVFGWDRGILTGIFVAAGPGGMGTFWAPCTCDRCRSLAGLAIRVIAGGVVGFIGWQLLQSYIISIISCPGQ